MKYHARDSSVGLISTAQGTMNKVLMKTPKRNDTFVMWRQFERDITPLIPLIISIADESIYNSLMN